MSRGDASGTHRHMTRGGYTLALVVVLGGALLAAVGLASMLH